MLDTLPIDPTVVVPLVVGLLSAVEHYRRTGRVPAGRLPYRAAREALRQLGNVYGARDRPRGVPGLVVDADAEHLERTLRMGANYESVDLYSYEYAGEVLNLRRPSGTIPDPDTGDPIPSEVHIRAFDLADGGLWCIAHEEPSRFEQWADHMSNDAVSWSDGRNALETVLGVVGIESSRRGSEKNSAIEVVA